jgi:hypothetical protein
MGKEQYRVGVSDRFAVLEHMDAEVDINSDCELLERISRFHPKRLHVIIN